jgi:2Fe-2S ferredoxin
MAKSTYRHPDGRATVLDIPAPNTVMRGAKTDNVEDIEALSGGSAQCGTCHVCIDEANTLPLPEMHESQDDVLHRAAGPRRETSRLSCQIPIPDESDGLVVHLPQTQV